MLALAGCGGGGGGGNDSGGLSAKIALAQANWIVVDLASGESHGYSSAPNLSNDDVRTDRMVFIALPTGSVGSGSPPGTRWGLPDEVVGSASAGRIFVSVFAVTRGQWQRLAGNTPWTRLSAELRGATDDRLPACGLSLDIANAGCATATARGYGSFRPLTSREWEYASRAGAPTRFHWGDATTSATVGLYAHVAETAGSNPSPQRVGSRLPNAFGLYDMAGGIWQLTSDGLLCGGSWRDSLPMARAANRISIDRSTPNGLVGTRLVFDPDNF